MIIIRTPWMAVPLVLTAWSAALAVAGAGEVSVADAWKELPGYEYGQDMAPLLAIDRVVIQSMASPEKRSACAARLGALLEAKQTTHAARQYVCLQLRQIGTPRQVPVLARLLARPKTSQMARYALEAIPGKQASTALRDALATLHGGSLVGVINSVAARRDARAVPALKALTDSPDRRVAEAAIWALGTIADDAAAAALAARAATADVPTPGSLAVPMLRAANALVRANKAETARMILAKLSRVEQPAGVRRAALEGLLRLPGKPRAATVLAWFVGGDTDRQQVAAAHLDTLADEQFDKLLAQIDRLPNAGKLAALEVAASRRGKKALPMILALAQNNSPNVRRTAIRALGTLGDESVIPFLVARLSGPDETARAARDALIQLPREPVVRALLVALTHKPASRVPVIGVLKKLKCCEAIDPLIAIAAQTDPAVYGPALDGLRGIADPDLEDLPRLVALVPRAKRGKHRDEVEKTILVVCRKLSASTDPSAPVLAALKKARLSNSADYLPLLGRLGGRRALAMIENAMTDRDPAVQEAAVRALCNWPNAEVADRLARIAADSANTTFRRWALRAYVRVVSLKSDRPERETLAMLQRAMKLATATDDRRLILRRAATVRTMPAVNWIAKYLDDGQVAQAACQAIVALAHHRFLRQPHMDQFAPLLDRVSKISKDPAVVRRARRYRLGL